MLCPVRALRIYLSRTTSVANHPRNLFVSPRSPSRCMSKNGISYFLCEVIHEAGASREVGVPVRAHSIRGISTSTTFHKNWSVSSVLAAATGGPIQCLRPSISRISLLSVKVFVPWDRSWQWVSRLVSSHLFLHMAGEEEILAVWSSVCLVVLGSPPVLIVSPVLEAPVGNSVTFTLFVALYLFLLMYLDL